MYTLAPTFSNPSFKTLENSKFITSSYISLYVAPGSTPPCGGVPYAKC